MQWEDFIRHVVRRYAVASWLDRRRQRRAACRARAAELEGTALARRAGHQDLRRADVATIALPTKDRRLAPYTTGEPIVFPSKEQTHELQSHRLMRRRMWWPIRSPTSIRGSTRRSTGRRPSRFRHYLWDLGLGVAEAMDTAQRGGGLDWPARKRTDPPRAGSGEGRARASRSAAASAPIISTRGGTFASTTSSAPTRSRSRRSKRWAASSW